MYTGPICRMEQSSSPLQSAFHMGVRRTCGTIPIHSIFRIAPCHSRHLSGSTASESSTRTHSTPPRTSAPPFLSTLWHHRRMHSPSSSSTTLLLSMLQHQQTAALFSCLPIMCVAHPTLLRHPRSSLSVSVTASSTETHSLLRLTANGRITRAPRARRAVPTWDFFWNNTHQYTDPALRNFYETIFPKQLL